LGRAGDGVRVQKDCGECGAMTCGPRH